MGTRQEFIKCQETASERPGDFKRQAVLNAPGLAAL
jgi:hypothetical protein